MIMMMIMMRIMMMMKMMRRWRRICLLLLHFDTANTLLWLHFDTTNPITINGNTSNVITYSGCSVKLTKRRSLVSILLLTRGQCPRGVVCLVNPNGEAWLNEVLLTTWLTGFQHWPLQLARGGPARLKGHGGSHGSPHGLRRRPRGQRAEGAADYAGGITKGKKAYDVHA